MSPLAFLLHGAAAGLMAYGWLSLQQLPISALLASQKGGHFQFLTIQGLLVAWLTMVASLVSDIAPSVKILRGIKRILLMASLPLSVVISTIYWTLLLAMPHLILRPDSPVDSEPSASSEAPGFSRIPLSTDLALHAVPGVALLLDFLLFEKKYSKKQVRYGFVLMALVGTWYSVWVEHCAKYNGTFPYPFLTLSPFHIRVAIYAGASLFAYLSFIGLNSLGN
ncbi:hypothetical protein K474DRAFT_1654899 [Panus rudis PR-1116 ss-1]|nr:hypothetical protein K474DRAFT_1654899 [Panus rudis PR-1116 ss-1]